MKQIALFLVFSVISCSLGWVVFNSPEFARLRPPGAKGGLTFTPTNPQGVNLRSIQNKYDQESGKDINWYSTMFGFL